MKRKLSIALIAAVVATMLTGCTPRSSQSYRDRVVGQTVKWEAVRVNDSIIICLPAANNDDDDAQPMVINLKCIKQ